MKNFFNVYVCFILVFIFLLSCRRNEPVTKIHEEEKEIPSVCIWDKISVRELPEKNSKSVATLDLGEAIVFTGKKVIDTTFHNQVYLQLLFQDKRMWVPQMAVEINAMPGVIKEASIVYQRPDLLTVSDKKIHLMEIVAINSVQDEWCQFVNEKRQVSGWVKSSHVSYNKDDISFALFAARKLNEINEEPLLARINFILKNNPYPGSSFVEVMKEIRQKEEEKLLIQNIITRE